MDQVTDCQSTRNPLYCKVVLEELRVFGIFEAVSEKIEQLLNCGDVEALFKCVVERIIDDFSEDLGAAKVVKALQLLAYSVCGLMAHEVADLLGAAGDWCSEATQMKLTVFLFNVRQHCSEVSGKICITHKQLRESIEHVCGGKTEINAELAIYFDKSVDLTQWLLTPHHLAESEQWSVLATWLQQPRALFSMSSHCKQMLVSHWRRLLTSAPVDCMPYACYSQGLANLATADSDLGEAPGGFSSVPVAYAVVAAQLLRDLHQVLKHAKRKRYSGTPEQKSCELSSPQSWALVPLWQRSPAHVPSMDQSHISSPLS